MTDKNKNNSAPDAAGVFKPLLRGTVVFYNKDKGFGFIHTDDKKDFHFGHRAFSGTKLPEAGDLVEFTVSPRPPKPGKSPNVEHLEIVGKDNNYYDGKELCPHCGKRVAPRMGMDWGMPVATYCPSCGGVIKNLLPKSTAVPQTKLSRIFNAVKYYSCMTFIVAVVTVLLLIAGVFLYNMGVAIFS